MQKGTINLNKKQKLNLVKWKIIQKKTNSKLKVKVFLKKIGLIKIKIVSLKQNHPSKIYMMRISPNQENSRISNINHFKMHSKQKNINYTKEKNKNKQKKLKKDLNKIILNKILA